MGIADMEADHCGMAPCRMNGTNWMKHFVSHLLCISHSQWVFCNTSLHNKSKGHIYLKEQNDVLAAFETLVETNPNNIP